ncbi:MAG TPA: MaoC family dehydratase [Dehalococcoidia bacterium]|nr:MaoC family dehydratase [Dehalococcoidia bacterium]
MQSELRFAGTHDLLSAEIGHEITPVEMVITEEMVERHAWANDDYNPWYIRDSPFGGRIAPPTFLSYDTDIMIWNHFTLPEGKGIWAKQKFEFMRPLMVGKKVKITGKIVDKVAKRGRDHISFEFLVTEEDGTEVVRMLTVHAFPLIARSER